MKVAVMRCLLPKCVRTHLPTSSTSTSRLTISKPECNTRNRHTSWKWRFKGPTDPSTQPWRPLASWIQFVAADDLRECLLSNVSLDMLSNGIHQGYSICVQGIDQI